LKKETAVMFAKWKSAVLVATGILPVLWVAVCKDHTPSSAPEIAMNEPVTRDCTAPRARRCTVAIKYAYPAAELLVLPDDRYF
jgi:hypothetical protein